MFAVALGLQTFGAMLRGALVLCFVDNEGVRVAIQRAGNRAPEVSHLVHFLWLTCARDQVAWYSARVESHANIADAPSRSEFYSMRELKAQLHEPQWPAWALNLW